MKSTTILTLVDGVQIVVPDSLNLITPYVIREQQDWFEDEIKFLRRLLRTGQKIIDIGANYGVYTLSMAKTVGKTGRVWSFEPASGTARLLAEGIALNGFTQVILDQCAVSSEPGSARLSLNENSELNAVVHGVPSNGLSETVPMVTLDECLVRFDWHDIAFMKIDAEGEEANILKGGKRFFAERSPLVQYEIRADAAWHMELVEQFAALSYDSYRLVPGLDLLVPFSADSTPDGYLLNLFSCKHDRAELLAANGYLLDSADRLSASGAGGLARIREWIRKDNRYNWRNSLAKLPYGAQLAGHWERTMAAGDSGADVDEALSLYMLSRDSSRTSGQRFSALEASFGRLKILCERQTSYLRLASLARAALDYGARTVAVEALQKLCNTILEHRPVDLGEPFLAPAARFETVAPGSSAGDWVLAAALEELERLGSYSSFYTGASGRQRLEIIRTLGFGSAEMERRLYLLQQRFDVGTHQEPGPVNA